MGNTSNWVNSPTLSIELYVTCPKCGEYFDLFETPLNDNSELMEEVLPDRGWADAHEKFECEATCPECGAVFPVRGVNW